VNTRFQDLVAENWTRAVAEASFNFSAYEPEVVASLGAIDPEERSAAVAVALEANAYHLHDRILALFHDENEHVRHEVLEYIAECGTPKDCDKLIKHLRTHEHSFNTCLALVRASGLTGPVIDDDDTDLEKERLVSEWEILLRKHGLLR
jgi:HEAT repeat protein